MKKLILSLAILFGLGATAQAQNWEFTLMNTTTVVTNTVQNKGVYNTDQIYLDFDVKNISSGTLNAYITRKVINQPGDGWYEQVCFGNNSGGFCVDLDSSELEWTSTDVVIIPATETGLVNIKIKPEPSEAPALYRYYIGVQGDLFQDSIDFSISSTVSVDEIEKQIALSVSPNPASENVSIKVSNFEKGNIKIVDVLGNVIKNETFSGSKTVNVAEFRNGVYFIIISGDGVKTINRKLVVRH